MLPILVSLRPFLPFQVFTPSGARASAQPGRMGQAPGFDQYSLLRLPSEDSLPSLNAEGFAQIQQEDLQFFAYSDGSASASSPSEPNSPIALPGTRRVSQPQFLPLALRPQFMYRVGLRDQIAYRPPNFRFAASGHNLADLLFGTQPCSLLMLCLDSHEWRALILCSLTCHDNVAVQAIATAMPLPFQV